MRISNIKVQFQINTAPQINAGGLNKHQGNYLKFEHVDPAFIWNPRLLKARCFIDKIQQFNWFEL